LPGVCFKLYLRNASITMIKQALVIFTFLTSTLVARSQQILPAISVKNMSGKIIVSWRNEYSVPVSNISIQRSYDSLKNYTTIGSVLNPQNKENGYSDATPPYNKMYYRVFIAFEGGSYIISQPVRPVKEGTSDSVNVVRYPWQVNPLEDSTITVPPVNTEINYPSKRIYTARDNSIVIYLPDAPLKKYSVKFFDETEKFAFELTKLHEEYLILEKVNFSHSGWYRFEIYDEGKIVEKNKFFVPRDGKNSGPEPPKKSR
jgi:hypothetical protein